MSRKLYYTVQSILSELAEIIMDNNVNLPEKISECYLELDKLSLDLDRFVEKTGMDSTELIAEIYDVYQDMLDIYFNYLEKQYEPEKETQT